MLRDEGVVGEAVWAGATGVAMQWTKSEASEPCRAIDRELRRIAKRKAALDIDEARWLREAERHRVWRRLGFSTLLEYLEDVFGYGPRTAKERLRVAKELGELPALEAEMRSGTLSYSAARELTRVMTRATEGQWLAHAHGKNLRDIEKLVVGHKKGDSPNDPKDPSLMTRRVVFELDARRDALLQQVRAMFEAERGEYLEDADLMEAMCMRVLAGGDGGRPADTTKAARPAHQIVIRRCDDCARAWQQGRGALVGITSADLELAACDAELVREADVVAAQAAGTRRPAPTLTIPQKTRDLVWARDEGRCRFPGCRATRNLAVHHIVHRANGGGHEPANLLVLCDGHHKLLHEGTITITGSAPDELVFTRDGKPLVDARSPAERRAGAALRETSPTASTAMRPSRFADVVNLEHAKRALCELGFKRAAAKQALEAACAHVGTAADTPTLVRAALQLSCHAELDRGDTATASLARQALVQAGFSAAIADKAVAAARAHVGTEAELAALIREALRYCR